MIGNCRTYLSKRFSYFRYKNPISEIKKLQHFFI